MMATRSLEPGTLLGLYEVHSSLGEGGMGAVYRARDTRLKRDVAIKVLLPEVASDPERLARFQREAEVLASLNHPHIAQIYGLEGLDGRAGRAGRAGQAGLAGQDGLIGPFLVLELVEGPTLADRIAGANGRGLPIDEALPIARQIAEALEAAHERGIIHRDLKPANIKVKDDGTVKVLDFGLAKAIEKSGGSGQTGGTARVNRPDRPDVPDLSASPTITSPALMTGVGVLLGTAAYMSPEQAKGRVVDRRADLWAFGCVLYEMLTGQRAFPGDDVTDTIVAVLSREPQWTALPASTPVRVRTLLRRCLERDAKQRLDSAVAARLELDDRSDDEPGSSSARPARRPSTLILVGALVTGLAIAAGISRLVPRTEAPRPVTRFSIRPPTGYGWSPGSPPALTLDGRRLAMIAVDANSRTSLWVRSLDVSESVALSGTDGASLPFWSPDGTQIGFFAEGKLKTIAVAGGTAQALVNVLVPGAATWARNGDIIFRPDIRGPLARIAARGGTPTPVTAVGENGRENLHTAPSMLDDGEHFVFTIYRNPPPNFLAVGSLAGVQAARRVENLVLENPQTINALIRSGYLLLGSDRSIVARPFDADHAAVSGEAIPLVPDVALSTARYLGLSFAASDDSLVYERGGAESTSVVIVDRAGVEHARLGGASPSGTAYTGLSVSPDGRRVVGGFDDIWMMDVTRDQRTRLTFDNRPAGNVDPVWSPDGKQVVFASHLDGAPDTLKLVSSSGSGVVRDLPVRTPSGFARPHAWSPDGRYVGYVIRDDKTGLDVWLLDMTASPPSPKPLLARPGNQQSLQFSPDGKWVTYESDETGRAEIFVQSFPDGDMRRQISLGGGNYPHWSRDGQALFWIALDGKMTTASIRTGPEFEVGAPAALFDSRLRRGGRGAYDVTPDGGFIIQVQEDRPFDEVHIIMNWPTLLKH